MLIVVVAIAVLTAVATEFAYNSRVDLQLAANQRDEVRAYFLARSGIGLSRLLLRFQKQLASYELLIVDELGFVPLSKSGAELLFEVFSQRYERGSTLVTSNLPFQE